MYAIRSYYVSWLSRNLRSLFTRRRQYRDTNQKAFQDLSRELRELAEIAARVWPEETVFQNRIVITSYSIHYTKLYERLHRRPT